MDAAQLTSLALRAIFLAVLSAAPLLAFVTAAGLLAAFIQSGIGYGDPSISLALRLLALAAALVIFGTALAAAISSFWTSAWSAALGPAGAPP